MHREARRRQALLSKSSEERRLSATSGIRWFNSRLPSEQAAYRV